MPITSHIFQFDESIDGEELADRSRNHSRSQLASGERFTMLRACELSQAVSSCELMRYRFASVVRSSGTHTGGVSSPHAEAGL